ncbi:right-handed parallel beta-helix repeat-containing protein [Lentzea aerocolonigenes]|uniref:right-handed parallel beta-helix repeat-containing protein n=1 Tax=Lentzea aerocolonigenes TaxID=68170 RepID=UPI0018C88583|nr:right-handed parallel beta-helix repeat-containing protein [Lentzea aerocolonigenes]
MTALAICVPVRQAGAAACIPSGTEAAINAALSGPGAKAVLCSGAVFSLSAPVRFTAPGQEITTEANAASPATLRIVSPALAGAVDGNYQDAVTLRGVVVDGNRPALGRLDGNVPALVSMGGALDQIVRDNTIIEPRTWSALHFYEGVVTDSVPHCQRGQIIGNRIGPAGLSPNWADGISLACGNSLVRDNTITDATDGAIVVFGAPGSTVENNTIVAEKRELLGGINLVDHKPMSGNYTGTVVRGNVIDAKSAFIKVGIAMGLRVWTCEDPGTVHGATVTGNRLRGLHMGYGYAINGVRDWTVTGNADESRHVGVPTTECGSGQADPGGYQVGSADASVLQPEFTSGKLNFAIGVTEPGILKVGGAPAGCTWLNPDEAVFPGRSQTSCDGRFRLTLQQDGNLVLAYTSTGQVLWASGTTGKRSAVALMQRDGNFVIYDSRGRAVWASGSGGRSGARLAVQDDGNAVIYSGSTVLWTSGTGGH